MRETKKSRVGGDARPPAGTHHGCCGLQWHEIIRDAAQLASVGPNTSRVGYGSGLGATPVLAHLPRGTVGKHPPSPLAVRLAAERPSPQPEVLGCPLAAKGAAVLPPYPETGQRQGGHPRVRLRRGTTA